MHSTRNNIKLTAYNDINGVIDEIFYSIRLRYQLLFYKCHKVNFRRGCLYIYSPDRIKKKKLTINSKIDGTCLQYAAAVALNYEEIKWTPERISNIKPFINKYNWQGINYPSMIDVGKRLRKIIRQWLLIFCILKKKKNVLLIFQTITEPLKSK